MFDEIKKTTSSKYSPNIYNVQLKKSFIIFYYVLSPNQTQISLFLVLMFMPPISCLSIKYYLHVFFQDKSKRISGILSFIPKHFPGFKFRVRTPSFLEYDKLMICIIMWARFFFYMKKYPSVANIFF